MSLWWLLTFLIMDSCFSPVSFTLRVSVCFSKTNCYFLLSYRLHCYNGNVISMCIFPVLTLVVCGPVVIVIAVIFA
jgi:hypothetical protein